MIIYTCPKCGGDLQDLVLASYPPQYKKECPKCGWSHIEKPNDEVVRIPYNPPEYSTPKVNIYASPYCQNCPSNMSNGGSGFCHCTLGTMTTC